MADGRVEYEPPTDGRILITLPLACGIQRFRTWRNAWQDDVAALRACADDIEHTARTNWVDTDSKEAVV